EAVVDRKKVALVNHRSGTKLNPRHRALLQLLRAQAHGAPPIHVPVRINKRQGLTKEFSQRTRSFLYAALAAAVAATPGLNRVRFYENGVISLNLPPSPQVVGSRATRTTHPRVLRGFGALFTALAKKKFEVENPFLWMTKTQVLDVIARAGCASLIEHTT